MVALSLSVFSIPSFTAVQLDDIQRWRNCSFSFQRDKKPMLHRFRDRLKATDDNSILVREDPFRRRRNHFFHRLKATEEITLSSTSNHLPIRERTYLHGENPSAASHDNRLQDFESLSGQEEDIDFDPANRAVSQENRFYEGQTPSTSNEEEDREPSTGILNSDFPGPELLANNFHPFAISHGNDSNRLESSSNGFLRPDSTSIDPDPSTGSGSPSTQTTDLDFYIPKVHDKVVGVVVSGNSHKLDIDIGSAHLGQILVKDVCPLSMLEHDAPLWSHLDSTAFISPPIGQTQVIHDGENLSITGLRVPIGSALFSQIFGITINGTPLLSSRPLAVKMAWHRIQQIYQQREPLELQVLEWNTDGLVCRIEGLVATLPLNQCLTRVTGSLKRYMGGMRTVLITEVDESKGKLLVSERQAWIQRNLQIGFLVQGTVLRIHKFGVEVSLSGTTLRAMVHISNISNELVSDIKSVFEIGETVKAVVVKSPVSYRIALSTAELESSRGLILQDKARVFQEAEEMAKKHLDYLRSLPQQSHDVRSSDSSSNDLSYDEKSNESRDDLPSEVRSYVPKTGAMSSYDFRIGVERGDDQRSSDSSKGELRSDQVTRDTDLRDVDFEEPQFANLDWVDFGDAN